MDETPDSELRRLAERRADAKLGFQSHLMAYLVVNVALAAINLMTSPGYHWFVWAAGGWGIGLVAHWAAVYTPARDLRERMVKANRPQD
jgi:hypothetical protein